MIAKETFFYGTLIVVLENVTINVISSFYPLYNVIFSNFFYKIIFVFLFNQFVTYEAYEMLPSNIASLLCFPAKAYEAHILD